MARLCRLVAGFLDGGADRRVVELFAHDLDSLRDEVDENRLNAGERKDLFSDSRLAVRAMRNAISPRLAIRTEENMNRGYHPSHDN